jgi:D-alanyl-D-alanine carboxypeptidase (penicillin-binding protein 5/6)
MPLSSAHSRRFRCAGFRADFGALDAAVATFVIKRAGVINRSSRRGFAMMDGVRTGRRRAVFNMARIGAALRFTAIGLGAVGILFGVGAAKAQQTFQTIAPNVLLMDADTHSVLFEKAADELVTPASTAKVMTAELVFREIKEGRLKLSDEFLISENAWRHGGAAAGGSSMFAVLNSKIRVEDLIRGLVIQSGNDAAIALAEGAAGSEGAFATMMTKRARELGLARSTFTNPWGRGDPDMKVTPHEMAFLADHVIETYPDLYKYFGEREFTWNKIRQLNRNPLLTLDIGADGLKTGNIDESGYGIVASAVQNGQRLILAMYGLKSAKDRAEEARKILMWGFRSFEAKTVFQDGETIGTASVYGGEVGGVPLLATGAVKVLSPRGSSEKLSAKIVYQGPLMPPVAEGQVVAHLKVWRGATEALDVPLRAARRVETGSLPRRALDAGYEFATSLLRKYFTKS